MKEELKDGKTEVNSYLKYSGLGFQIAGTLGVGVFIGYELDKYFKTSGPYFTLAFALVFMVAGFYVGFRGFMKKK